MNENPTTILVELYAEQAMGGASDEKLAMTMERIRYSLHAVGRDAVTAHIDGVRQGEKLVKAIRDGRQPFI